MPFLWFVLLEFSELCSTNTRNLLSVPKISSDAEIYVVQTQETCCLCLKATAGAEIYVVQTSEICCLCLKATAGAEIYVVQTSEICCLCLTAAAAAEIFGGNSQGSHSCICLSGRTLCQTSEYFC